MRRLAILLAVALTFPGAPLLAQCIDYGSYIHWAGSMDLPGNPDRIAVSGNRVYLTNGVTGLQIVDVTNPVAPSFLGTLDTPGSCADVRTASGFALVADGTNGLVTIDPGPPAAIVHTQPVGTVTRLDVRGSLAAACGAGTLSLIDVSSPLAPVVLGSTPIAGSVSKVKITATHVFLACFDSLRIVDISDPAHPVKVGAFDATGSQGFVSVDVEGSYAYVLDLFTGFEASLVRVLDISNPAAPVQVGTAFLYVYGFDLSVDGDRLYVTSTNSAGLEVFDVSDPSNPAGTFFMEFDPFARWHVRSGNRLYAISAVSPRRLSIVESLSNGVPPVTFTYETGAAEDLEILGNTVYACGGYPTLEILDISGAIPAHIGDVTFGSDYAVGMDVQSSRAFLASQSDGLILFNVANPASPSFIRQVDTGGTAVDVAVIGNYAYVADQEGGLVVVNVTNPATASIVNVIATPGDALGAANVGGLLYVMIADAGLLVFNLTNPAGPAMVGSLDTPGSATSLEVVGSIGFLADGFRGLQILNLSDPVNPSILGGVDTQGNATRVAISGSHAYVGDGSEGMAVIDVVDPMNPRRVGSHLGVYGVGVAATGSAVYVCDDAYAALRVLSLQCETSGVPDPGVSPVGLSLLPPFPNPSRGGPVTLRFHLDDPGMIQAFVADVRGARLRTLFDGVRPEGEGAITWDGRDDRGLALPGGVYFLNVTGSGGVGTRRIIRLP